MPRKLSGWQSLAAASFEKYMLREQKRPSIRRDPKVVGAELNHWKTGRARLTLDQYHAKLESQDFGCAICGRDNVLLGIDHHHKTGQWRGLLCQKCNTGIGMLNESHILMDQAKIYLTKWNFK